MSNEPNRLLEVLDPGHTDPGYWSRFHGRVMSVVSAELARRRLLEQELTVSQVVQAWWRVLVPAAALAAALAGGLLFEGRAAMETAPLGIEELLVAGLEGEPIPAVLISEEAPDEATMFAVIER
jgi:hypothetical protein